MLAKFHESQIIIAGIVLTVAMLIYVFGPDDRIQLPHDVALVCLAFLFGKFTNGFNRAKPTRWDDALGAKLDGEIDTGVVVIRHTEPEQSADTSATAWPDSRPRGVQ